MCNIIRKTKKKKVVGYKVVTQRKEGEFYSIFAQTPVTLGKVSKNVISTSLVNFNRLIIGKTTMFKELSIASNFWEISDPAYYNKLTILKVICSGEIYIGNAKGISGDILDNEVVYAASCIDSIEIVKPK